MPPNSTLLPRWHSRCAYCGTPLDVHAKRTAPKHPTVDHFIPRACPDRPLQNNRVLSCKPCNNAKAALDPRQLLKVWIQVDPDGFARAVTATLHWYEQQPPEPVCEDDAASLEGKGGTAP